MAVGYVASGGQVAYYAAPSLPAPWPYAVGALPPAADYFQDRAEAARLRQVLAGGGTTVLQSPGTVPAGATPGGALVGGVLAGMGGVGKTQLAAHYARTTWEAGELDVRVWVTATDRASIVASYAYAAYQLLATDTDDPELAAQEFLAWLEPTPGRPACRWLIVLDDVTDPADLNKLWPPTGPTGRVLVTTRRKDAALIGRHRHLVEVGLFTVTEAIDYLTRVLADHGRTEPIDQLTALAHDLGRLPLALAQAAAYLVDAGLSCAAYRTLLADRATTLAAVSPDTLPDGQTHTVAAAWDLSVDRADTLRPAGLARPMLQLAAFLDPNGIPQDVLTSVPVLIHLGRDRASDHTAATGKVAQALRALHRLNLRRHRGGDHPISTDEAVGALRALHRLSLITHTPDTPHQAVRVHQLIQRAMRDRLAPDQYNQLARTAAGALTAAWPSIDRDTQLAHALWANTDALTHNAQNALWQPDAHDVLFRAARSLRESGQASTAGTRYQHIADTAHQLLGPNHSDTLYARHELARCLGEAGDAAGAAAAYEQLLADRERVRGLDPGTLVARADLARWRREAGDAAGATTVLEQVLADATQMLGPHHDTPLGIRITLAQWRGEAGDVAGAVAAFEQLLADTLLVLGPNQPGILMCRAELARWRGEAGDAAGAVTALEQVLAEAMQLVGPGSAVTLGCRHFLARWRGEAGDVAGAVAGFEELLEHNVRVLGPHHPGTLMARRDLAHWQRARESADDR